MSEILESLRQKTRPIHEKLEQVVDVFTAAKDIESYGKLLKGFYRFYLAYETSLNNSLLLEYGFDYEKRRKLPLLIKDLDSLGVDTGDVVAVENGLLPDLENPDSAFGSLYVVEGATLGGQVISRQLNEKFQIGKDNGAAFFTNYGSNARQMWLDFVEALTKYSRLSTSNTEVIVDSAITTFDAFGQIVGGRKITNPNNFNERISSFTN
ncbi:MAG TPA: biliverdin-producing heme oxygenase [Pyrinomonadaceae bacterium]|nr:biliverdin-producing heme oxygenase [Pyrinomonadaceae bacterium]